MEVFTRFSIDIEPCLLELLSDISKIKPIQRQLKAFHKQQKTHNKS